MTSFQQTWNRVNQKWSQAMNSQNLPSQCHNSFNKVPKHPETGKGPHQPSCLSQLQVFLEEYLGNRWSSEGGSMVWPPQGNFSCSDSVALGSPVLLHKTLHACCRCKPNEIIGHSTGLWRSCLLQHVSGALGEKKHSLFSHCEKINTMVYFYVYQDLKI